MVNAMGRQKTVAEDMQGRMVIINDVDGDAFSGVVFRVDETGWLLVQSGAEPVAYLSPGAEPVPIENGCHIPAGRVKFVQPLGNN